MTSISNRVCYPFLTLDALCEPLYYQHRQQFNTLINIFIIVLRIINIYNSHNHINEINGHQSNEVFFFLEVNLMKLCSLWIDMHVTKMNIWDCSGKESIGGRNENLGFKTQKKNYLYYNIHESQMCVVVHLLFPSSPIPSIPLEIR